MHLHVIGLELTFAGRHPIGPPVNNIFAAKSSAVLEPSATRGAAADSAGFSKRAALWARYSFSGHGGDR